MEALFTVALACGLKAGEALGLQWSDCDLDNGTLTIRQTVQRFGGDAGARRLLSARRKRLSTSLREAKAAGMTELVKPEEAQEA